MAVRFPIEIACRCVSQALIFVGQIPLLLLTFPFKLSFKAPTDLSVSRPMSIKLLGFAILAVKPTMEAAISRRVSFALVCLFMCACCVSEKELDRLSVGSSLSPEENSTVLVSPNKTFSAGFYRVGDNAYSFAIWYTKTPHRTVVWMANRDQPVNGRDSLLLLRDGNLALSDANGTVIWTTDTGGIDVKDAVLLETGNLVLRSSSQQILWESFKYPTDTLLPWQPFSKNTQLVSRMSKDSFKSGYYRFYFDNDNVLRLIYDGLNVSSIYWPAPYNTVFQNGRVPYNSTRYAVLDNAGGFTSSDNLGFSASDYGQGPRRRLTMDIDGNLRLYSLDEASGAWNIVWMSLLEQCLVHGLCGINGLCIYTPEPRCTCPPGFHMIDSADWFKGCQRDKTLDVCNPTATAFIKLPRADYYGNDNPGYGTGKTLEECKTLCLNSCTCQGFAYYNSGSGGGICYPKNLLMNGNQSPTQRNDYVFVKVSINDSSVAKSAVPRPLSLACSSATEGVPSDEADVAPANSRKNEHLKFPLGFVIAFGVVEGLCITLGWWYMFRKYNDPGYGREGYLAIPTGFKRFGFAELKAATNNFRVSLGKGGFGTVYKGELSDNRVVAVKRLEGVSQGESQFWAEVTMIGRIHHMNLVRMFGFCAEGDHRLLVYEYVENGSLDKYLFNGSDHPDKVLDWNERFGIAVGTAKGLAYLHEECLEWILHCDIKPQNILLDGKFCPKVSDFGLAKLVDRERSLDFSTVRGTRGYLAPEWMMNLPITAKADVYSFGIVLLEMVSGRSASTISNEFGDLVHWVRERIKEEGWMKEVVDAKLDGNFDIEQVENAVQTALRCVEQDKNARPSMSEIVDLLTRTEGSS